MKKEIFLLEIVKRHDYIAKNDIGRHTAHKPSIQPRKLTNEEFCEQNYNICLQLTSCSTFWWPKSKLYTPDCKSGVVHPPPSRNFWEVEYLPSFGPKKVQRGGTPPYPKKGGGYPLPPLFVPKRAKKGPFGPKKGQKGGYPPF